MKIEFFEPPMCCSTGICGPSVDEKLVKLNENIKFLREKYQAQGLEIERYQMNQQPAKFKQNENVYNLVQAQGKLALPIATFNGAVIKSKGYPSLEEMEEKINEALNGN